MDTGRAATAFSASAAGVLGAVGIAMFTGQLQARMAVAPVGAGSTEIIAGDRVVGAIFRRSDHAPNEYIRVATTAVDAGGSAPDTTLAGIGAHSDEHAPHWEFVHGGGAGTDHLFEPLQHCEEGSCAPCDAGGGSCYSEFGEFRDQLHVDLAVRFDADAGELASALSMTLLANPGADAQYTLAKCRTEAAGVIDGSRNHVDTVVDPAASNATVGNLLVWQKDDKQRQVYVHHSSATTLNGKALRNGGPAIPAQPQTIAEVETWCSEAHNQVCASHPAAECRVTAIELEEF